MTQPTAELLQAIKGMVEKAVKDCPNVMYLPLPMRMLPTIIAALELKEMTEIRTLALDDLMSRDADMIDKS